MTVRQRIYQDEPLEVYDEVFLTAKDRFDGNRGSESEGDDPLRKGPSLSHSVKDHVSHTY